MMEPVSVDTQSLLACFLLRCVKMVAAARSIAHERNSVNSKA